VLVSQVQQNLAIQGDKAATAAKFRSGLQLIPKLFKGLFLHPMSAVLITFVRVSHKSWINNSHLEENLSRLKDAL
jgi:hypothetical protein